MGEGRRERKGRTKVTVGSEPSSQVTRAALLWGEITHQSGPVCVTEMTKCRLLFSGFNPVVSGCLFISSEGPPAALRQQGTWSSCWSCTCLVFQGHVPLLLPVALVSARSSRTWLSPSLALAQKERMEQDHTYCTHSPSWVTLSQQPFSVISSLPVFHLNIVTDLKCTSTFLLIF